MAPEKKRQNATKAPVVAKKAKVEATPEDPVLTQLAPIFAALSESNLPPSCTQLLHVALPHCFRGAVEERHAYVNQLLDLTSSYIKADEADKQASLKSAEEKVAALHANIESSKDNVQAAEALASAKLKDVETKNSEVTEATTELEAAKAHVKAAEDKYTEVVEAVKAAAADVLAFNNILTELWEPLKSSSFPSNQYRKRDKSIAQLVEKVAPVGIEEALLDAAVAALKQKQEKRDTFAEFTLKCILEQFERHQSLLAERAAATSDKEQEFVKDAECRRGEKQEALDAKDKEHMQLQNEWADLETAANESKKALKDKESELKDAETDVTQAKAAVSDAVLITEAFTKMKEQKETVVVEEKTEVVASEISAPETTEASEIAVAA